MTDYLLLRATAESMMHDFGDRIENEWHSGDEYDLLIEKRDRLMRFHDFLRLHEQFTP
jgi:hypothetical protein